MIEPTHYIVDLKYCNLGLDSVQDVTDFLEYTVTLMNMTPVTDAQVYQFACDPPNNGITGTIILAESLISIHTYPGERCAYIDLFSCKSFNVRHLVDYCKWFFDGELGKISKVGRYRYNDIHNDDRPH